MEAQVKEKLSIKRTPYEQAVMGVEKTRKEFFAKAKEARLRGYAMAELLGCDQAQIPRLRQGQKLNAITFVLMKECIHLIEQATEAGILPATGLDKRAQEAVLKKLL